MLITTTYGSLPPPALLTVSDVLRRLKRYQLPLTFSQARAYLHDLWNKAQLLSLYQHYFPAEFAASTASVRLALEINAASSDRRGSASTEGLYSPKELEFIRLVDERLFPLYLDFFLDEAEERQDLIYVPSFGIDWWQADFSDLEPGWQFLLWMTGSLQQEYGVPPRGQ